jgi:hypothetical protein
MYKVHKDIIIYLYLVADYYTQLKIKKQPLTLWMSVQYSTVLQ